MSSVCACVAVSGSARYFLAARQAIASVLDRTPFDVVVATGQGPAWLLPSSCRVRLAFQPDAPAVGTRAAPFLAKFAALEQCLVRTSSDFVLLLDADALVASPLDAGTVVTALDGRALGMVEQTTIRGSSMDRAAFLRHYERHALAWIDPRLSPPALDAFRYYNSGVVLAARDELRRITDWALETIRSTGPRHQVGEHMISDQDYFQVWANSLVPGSCRTLPWTWNHCEHWDQDFPRPDARVLHFSNFCQGPGARTLARMAWQRRRTG